MLKKRTLLALAFLVVAGGYAAWSLTRPDPYAGGGGSAKRPVAPMKKEDIDELEITEGGKPPVVLKKEGQEWKMTQPVADKADQRSVDAAVGTLAEMSWRDVIAEKKESWEKVGMKEDEVTKVVPKKGGKPLATLYVGKSGNVRVGDDARVWSVSDFKRWALAREPKMWRDREIVRLEPDKVEKIEVAYPGGAKVALTKEAEKWKLADPGVTRGLPADELTAGDVAASVMRMDAAEFVDEPLPADKTGLDAPRMTVTIKPKEGAEKAVQIGKTDGDQVYVKRPDSPRVWKIAKYAAERIPASPVQWADKTVVQIPSGDITKIAVTKGGATKSVDQPTGTAPAVLARLRANRIAEEQAGTGLDKPTATVAVTTKDGKTRSLVIGAQDKDKNYYVRVAGAPTIYLVGESTVKPLLAAAEPPADKGKDKKAAVAPPPVTE